MDNIFDLVVVGTGAAASTVANRCRVAGWSVAIVDELPYGGTCQLRGCDPKKVLRRGAEVVDAARMLHGKGIADPGLRIDWLSLMRFKRSFTEPVPANKEAALADKGIATYRGTARFVADNALEVGGERLEGRHVIIASGAEPVPLPIAGAEHVTTSDRFLELDQLPRRVLFIGGGYVSFEFAHLATRADAEVVVLDRGERPLKAFDPDLVAKLLKRTRALGIDFRAQAAVEAIERTGAGLRVTAEIDGRSETFEADLVVHGAGRAPALERLDLERGNVRADKKGVAVNQFLQSLSNPRIYAAGDAAATAGALLTPVASLEGAVVAINLLEGNRETPDYTGVPSAVFTIPELTRVGLDEESAREQGLEVEIKTNDMSDWYSVERVGEHYAAAKVLLEKGTSRILGAHLLGPEASELINFFGLAIRTGLTATDLKKLVSAYPSAASDLGYLI
jgi:glutathione reductase (NADPH)